MPSVDIRTLILLLGLGNLLLFLALASFRFVQADARSSVTRTWTLSKLLQGLAWGLLWLRGEIPPFWSIEVGNTLLLGGVALEALAAWRFATGRTPRWLVVLVAAAVLARYPLNGLGNADAAQRVVVASLLVAGLFGVTGWAVLWKRVERTPLQFVVGGCTLLLAGVVMLRGLVAAWPGQGFALFDANFIQVATFLALFLLMLVNGVGVVLLDTERSGERLNTLATRDSLTGVSNHRDFQRRLRVMLASASRNRYPLTLMAVDLDHFKQVNDTYGHPVGDAVLHSFAQWCEAAVRESDVVGRVGGEEFMVGMNGASLEEATAIAERLRAAVAASRVAVNPRESVEVTVSIGLATLTDSDDVATLVARADAALYRAKRNGRNRVEIDGQVSLPTGQRWREPMSELPVDPVARPAAGP
ncbi:GGDEF domain-containing protein [Denitromonas iodatirespirans]|uniref:diguanylate cyclase n=1 Tax=Denitromonas iodatirespirans TaxID=2795389 RepID=A0A944DJL6_DENI1|nr:GGDEF domain-containing protein [Denitromonas iodatirespirans]MBT0960019.1 GGDEF domain-containing protein [Denitromonas iodatirespirans]